MFQGTSNLQELAKRLEENEAAKQDYVVDTRQLVMMGDIGESPVPILGINQDGVGVARFPLLPNAHSQIAARLKIPAVYYKRMVEESPELLARNVNHWFREKPENRMIRALHGEARAFLSDHYARIDNHEVADVALPIVMELGEPLGLRVASCDVTPNRLYLKFVTERVEAEVKVGDVVQQGLVISNSEIGLGALNVQPMIFRLVCLNGMISGAALKKYHVGRKLDSELQGLLSDDTRRLEDAATLGRVRDVVGACLDRTIFDRTVARMQEAGGQRIEGDPVKAVEVLGNSLGFTQGEQTGVLRHLIEGADLSRYGLANAVTRMAQDVETYDRATDLEEAGGRVIDLAPAAWQEVQRAA